MPERIPLYVYGASGHGKVVAEAARQTDAYVLRGFLDDDENKWGQPFHGVTILGGLKALPQLHPRARVALGIGANQARRRIFDRLQEAHIELATVVHPSASVSKGAVIGDGTVVGPLAVVHVDARVGRGCIVNSAAVIEHDNVLGDWVHTSPNVALGGNVRIGRGTHVGLGASVLPGTTIGAWCVVGAGACVTRPLPDLVVAVGVPARVVRTIPDESLHKE